MIRHLKVDTFSRTNKAAFLEDYLPAKFVTEQKKELKWLLPLS